MMEEIYFSKDPIVEALISIEVESSDDSNVELLGAADTGYSGKEPIIGSNFMFDVQTASARGEKKNLGYKFTSDDGKQIAQFKTDGFIFSRLAPYNGWNAFSTEAQRLWKVYEASLANRPKPKSLVVRYINKLMLPMGPNIDSYLNVYTFFPDDYQVTVQSYFVRLEIVLAKPTVGVLIMQQAQTPSGSPEILGFLLDNEFRFPISEVSEIWPLAADVRRLKNETFDRILTDRTKELLR
jgi:uncharacterized protein (TIGR04255 family)